MKSAIERFEEKFIPEPNSGCWLWFAAKLDGSYGNFSLEGKKLGAHRASYILYVGDIPAGKEINHICSQKECVNPEHLEVTDRSGNMRHAHARRGRKTHCPAGHPYSGDNLYKSPSGVRICKKCRRATEARYRGRKGGSK